MCLAIYKPAGAVIPVEHLRNGHDHNDDGCGFCYSENGKLFIVKGMFSFEEFYKLYKPKEHLPMLIHFRAGTHGGKNTLNCHPFSMCNGQYALIHNGVIPIHCSVKELSDTGNFAKLVMEPMLKQGINPTKPSFVFLVEQAIGRHNKVCLMNAGGNVMIYNEDEGEHEDAHDKDGNAIMVSENEPLKVWYSNGGYKWASRRYTVTNNTNEDEYNGVFEGSPTGEDVTTSAGDGFMGPKLDPPPDPNKVIQGFKAGTRTTADPGPMKPAKSAAASAAAIVSLQRTEKNGKTIRITLPSKSKTLLTPAIDIGSHTLTPVESGPIFGAKDELEIAFLMEDMRITREQAIKALGLDVNDAITFIVN